MLALLPLVALALLILAFYSQGQSFRRSVLFASLVWGVLIAFSTEILSTIKLLNFPSLIIFWSAIIGLLAFKGNIKSALRKLKTDFKLLSDLPGFLKLVLGGMSLVFLLVGVTAIVAAPNNWDSLTYHMSRVAHWIQNRGLEHYPTYYPAQLYHPPFAEIIITHFNILSQNDVLANFVQWLAMAGSAIGVSLIAQQLGADRRGQIFAALFSTTLPMGILQGSSTQNDYVVCYWLVCLAYTILLSSQSEETSEYADWKVGVSLGLALYTKTSAYLFALPFMLWYVFFTFKKSRWQSWKPFLILGILALALNTGHFYRNFDLFGSPITGGPQDMAVQYKMEIYSPSAFISNFVRNITAFHVNTGFRDINAKINAAVRLLHRFIGLDPSDPRTTMPGQTFGVFAITFDENVSGNPVHFVVLLITLGFFFFQKLFKKNSLLSFYSVLVLLAYCIFCLLLKWQPYNSRHHLSLFVLIAPLVGITLAQIPYRRFAHFLMILLLVMSFPWVLKNEFHPIAEKQNIFNTPRIEQYFVQRKWIQSEYFAVTQKIESQQCFDVGFYFQNDPDGKIWEYPFWVLLNQGKGDRYQLRHIYANNISGLKLNTETYQKFSPCLLVAARYKGLPEFNDPEIFWKGKRYAKQWSNQVFTLYAP